LSAVKRDGVKYFVCLEKNGRVWTHFDVNAYHRFAEVAQRVKAGVAQLQAELVFALGMEAAVALVAGAIFRTLALFAGVHFGMDFERDHNISPL